ncbi:putative 2-aminoethylphosphonate ABC transporter permease subunit [Ideonella dechloratans]|uniref:Putative 2-aminoethylphosphonate ABC transporter permease subunit n=1 Tax=Ideonella dechloratans TaxID=36863 RepID=A0A643FGE2_IDEDE|nr:putative 2-aminoethylphosphonate ABC transporter permease subunit [Ideonella dechloratans]KAB0583249.1 putative 2-aminoethylphosphonate ABC transporter permease subunit [Ideonella dechloratans]UFU10567.1 putative 2-aminoethylphosphonate ABC transporter permease subunit [Ideonella dechloratans]
MSARSLSAEAGAVVLPAAPTLRLHWTDWLARGGLLALAALLGVGLVGPLLALLGQAFAPGVVDGQRQSAWQHFVAYLGSPALLDSLWHSLWVSVLITLIVLPLAFTFAYALTRSAMPAKGLFRTLSLVPLLAPSLLSAISLIYWFGNQGLAKDVWLALGFDGIYGAPGIVLAECFAVFPHTLMILVTALALADARLYEAAAALGTSRWRVFFTITLPGAKYGLISAALVTFTLVVTDFGVPKVVGGDFNVLATDVFKLVIGQQDFQRGAVVALLLLAPALLTFGVDHWVQRRQTAQVGARAVPLVPRRSAGFDLLMTAYCSLIALLMLAMAGMAVFASFVAFWPYNLTLSLDHYTMGLVDAELGDALLNSLKLAAATALIGPVVVFLGAYLLEKTRGWAALRPLLRLMAMLPMAVPGLVLGLGSIFFFNAPANPLHGLYQTGALLVLCTVVHFYTTGHLTLVTALKALDPEFEAVSASLKVPFTTTLRRVTLPICLPALIDVSRYFFVNAMTTISAVVFLYTPDTKLASVAILNLDEAGDIGPAAAMAVLIMATSLTVNGLYLALGAWAQRRTQAWRQPAR